MYTNEPYLLELLKEAQLVTPAALEDAKHKKKSQESTIDALLSLNLLTDEAIAQTLAENAGME